ncbi:MAG: type 4a pilus biogenesis protein PilO, partial [Candidatus Omnitrophota bacterium]
GALFFFLLLPQDGEFRRINNQLEKRQKELNEKEAMLRSVPDPEKQIEELKKSIKELEDKSASQKEELPRIIQQLINTSSKLAVDIVSIKPRDDIKEEGQNVPKGVAKAYIEMRIRAPYDVLGDFFQELNSLPIVFTIEHVHIENRDRGSDRRDDRSKKNKSAKDDTAFAGDALFATLLLSTYTILSL